MVIFLPTKKPPSCAVWCVLLYNVATFMVDVEYHYSQLSVKYFGTFLFIEYLLRVMYSTYMPVANPLKAFVSNKHSKYTASDIPEILITQKILDYAWTISPLLDGENKGVNTRDGGKYKNIKGTLGHLAVALYLKQHNWRFKLSKPYVEKQRGDKYDILFGKEGEEEIWEVKCREYWTEKYCYNIRLYMGDHEKKSYDDPSKPKPDWYIFTTVERDFSKAYILGGLSGGDLWNKLEDLTEEEHSYTKYPTYGKTYSRFLTPITGVILRS